MAQASLDYFRKTGEDIYYIGAKRWTEIICSELSSPTSDTRYAEHYGRIIVFLSEMADLSGDRTLHGKAGDAVQMAVEDLWRGKMFVGHSNSRYVDAVDGIGFLLLGMLFLQPGQKKCRELF